MLAGRTDMNVCGVTYKRERGIADSYSEAVVEVFPSAARVNAFFSPAD